jgi:autotransporter-associated beta strand protein
MDGWCGCGDRGRLAILKALLFCTASMSAMLASSAHAQQLYESANGAVTSSLAAAVASWSALPAYQPSAAATQLFYNADGTRTNSLTSAAATWAALPGFAMNPSLATLNAQYAFAYGFNGAGVKIGLVDTSVDAANPDFSGAKLHLLTTTGTYTQNGVFGTSVAGQPFTLSAGNLGLNVYPNPSIGAPSQSEDIHGTLMSSFIVGQGGTGPGVTQQYTSSGVILAPTTLQYPMGVAPGADLYVARSIGQNFPTSFTGGIDGGVMGASYDALVAQGVRAINAEWQLTQPTGSGWAGVQSQYDADPNNGTLLAMQRAAAAGVIVIMPAGNQYAQPAGVGASLPLFLNGQYQNDWLSVVAGDNTSGPLAMASYSNICGATKYWCVVSTENGVGAAYATPNGSYAATPSNPASSTTLNLLGGGGTSEASAQALGSLSVVMERFPYMTNQQARDVLLTTATQLPGQTGVSAVSGFGMINLQTAMNGPGQLLGPENIVMPKGMSDTWSNNISEAAIKQRLGDIAYETSLQSNPTFQAAQTANAQTLYNAYQAANAAFQTASTSNNTALLNLLNEFEKGTIDFTTYLNDSTALEANLTAPQAALNAAQAALQNDPIGRYLFSGASMSAAVASVLAELPADQAWLQSFGNGPVAGSLSKWGGGTLTLSGVNGWTGGTNVFGGVLALSGGGTLGDISGATRVYGGVLDLGGTSQVQNGGVGLLGGMIANGTISSTTNFDLEAGVASAALAGSGGATKTGNGTVLLTGQNTYTGATNVDAGLLIVNGSIASSPLTSINAGGVLAGDGVVGNTLVNGGVLAPSDPLTVQGNLVFTTASTYLISVGSTGAGGANVTGAATPGGATVEAAFSGSAVTTQELQRYTILTASGGVAGTFNPQVMSNLPMFAGALSYDANDVYLTTSLSSPASLGLNGNQTRVFNTLVNTFNTTGGIPVAFAALGPSGLTQVSGETATGAQQSTFTAMNQFMGLITDPFLNRGGGFTSAPGATGYAEEGAASAYAANKPADAYALFTKVPLAKAYDPHWSVWASDFGGQQTTSGNAVTGSNDARSSLYGMAVGADYLLSPNTIAGFAIAGGHTTFSVNTLGGGQSDLFQAGAYLRHTDGNAYVTGALAYGFQDITTDRFVSLPGLAMDHLSSTFNANAYSGRIEGGYRFVAPGINVGLTPYAAAQVTAFDLPSYAETVTSGLSTYALNYASKDATDPRTELGVRSDKSFGLDNGVLTLRGRLAWAHDYDTDRSVAATFQSLPGASFVVNGAAPAHDSALTTASLEMKWRNGWSAAATFDGEFSNVTTSYAGKGVFRYVW